MNILKFLFGKSSKIIYCGRAGLIYKRYDCNYFVDSEFLDGKPDIVIYWENIRLESVDAIELTRDRKAEIASEVKKELETEGLSVELFPLNGAGMFLR